MFQPSLTVMTVALFLAGMPESFAQATEQVIVVQAESYVNQREDSLRSWQRFDAQRENPKKPQAIKTASGGAYVQLLPDTRKTHGDRLIPGENFSNEPGKLAILDYQVDFPSAGRYYVWVRAFSTGSEDNGIHVGLNGTWPENGQRMQWCEGKHQWTWESKQRTAANHCGEAFKIYLDIPTAGTHTVSFSMREDGFAMDAFALTPRKWISSEIAEQLDKQESN